MKIRLPRPWSAAVAFAALLVFGAVAIVAGQRGSFSELVKR
jgi:hypothetical protein